MGTGVPVHLRLFQKSGNLIYTTLCLFEETVNAVRPFYLVSAMDSKIGYSWVKISFYCRTVRNSHNIFC